MSIGRPVTYRAASISVSLLVERLAACAVSGGSGVQRLVVQTIGGDTSPRRIRMSSALILLRQVGSSS